MIYSSFISVISIFIHLVVAFRVVNMADELSEVCAGRQGGAPVSNHEIRVNIDTDTLLWKYLSDLQGLRGAGQEDEWEEKKDEWEQTFR